MPTPARTRQLALLLGKGLRGKRLWRAECHADILEMKAKLARLNGATDAETSTAIQEHLGTLDSDARCDVETVLGVRYGDEFKRAAGALPPIA